MKYNNYTFEYKRHLTIQQAETFAKKWIDEQEENTERDAEIQYKKTSNDYTVRYSKKW